jgi:ATP synthase subunit 6
MFKIKHRGLLDTIAFVSQIRTQTMFNHNAFFIANNFNQMKPEILIMHSPLEQFSVLTLMPAQLGWLDLTFTNSAVYCVLTLISVRVLWSMVLLDGGLVVPSRYQAASEMLYEFVNSLVQEQLGPEGHKYVAIVFTTWLYILTANMLGLIPFSFATTAQLVVAFGLSFSLFIGVTMIGVIKHGLHFLSFFLPSGAPIGLAPLLVVIELISYVFRPISLGVRLFANITAGHSLLAIIAGFAWSIGTCGSLFAIVSLIPVVVIVAIYGLELAVAFLQAYVFGVLLCIYLKDAIELH